MSLKSSVPFPTVCHGWRFVSRAACVRVRVVELNVDIVSVVLSFENEHIFTSLFFSPLLSSYIFVLLCDSSYQMNTKPHQPVK